MIRLVLLPLVWVLLAHAALAQTPLAQTPLAQTPLAQTPLAQTPLAQTAGGKRVALVVGNNAYAYVTKLENPVNDARLMASTLKAAGFTLVGGGPLTDASKQRLDAAVAAFGKAIEGADAAVFYYSGHGLQVGGVNYLVPVDANPTSEKDLDFQMVTADVVLRQLGGSGTKLNLVILDACRNNPFGGKGLRAVNGGLAEMRAPEGTLISYATEPGSVAQDGTGHNSPFTTALAETMRVPGLDLLRLFNRVGVAVKKSTGGSQQPWFASSPLEGEFYFTPGAAPVAAAAAAPVAASPAQATPPTGKAAPEPGKLEPGKLALNATPATGAAPAAGGTPVGGRCPRPGTATRSSTGERLLWQGVDPADPEVCLAASGTSVRRLLFGWQDADAPGVRAALPQLRAFFSGGAATALVEGSGVQYAWSRAGSGTLRLGGQTRAVERLDVMVTEYHILNSLGTDTRRIDRRGQWHLSFDPLAGLFVAGEYERFEGPRRGTPLDWSLDVISVQ